MTVPLLTMVIISSEWTYKSFKISCCFPLGRIVYTVGSDGEVKEIVGGVVRSRRLVDSDGLFAMVLSNSDQILYVTGSGGSIYSVELPLKDTSILLEFSLHNQTCHFVSIYSMTYPFKK